MVGLVNEHQLVFCRVVLVEPILGRDAGETGNGDICATTCVGPGHLDVDGHVWVGRDTVLGSLFDQLLAVGQHQSAGACLGHGLDAAYQLSEDDLQIWLAVCMPLGRWLNVRNKCANTCCLPAPCSQRDAQPLLAIVDGLEDGLDAFFLVVSQNYRRRPRQCAVAVCDGVDWDGQWLGEYVVRDGVCD